MMPLRRTPLFAVHQRLGARLVEFGGWEMPVHYSGIVDEHHCVRRAAGLFDISHMGEVFVEGGASETFLNGILANDLRKLAVGQGQYTHLCNERGGTVDDLYAYRIGPERYLLILNASRIDVDVAWIVARWESFPDRGRVVVDPASDRFGALAIQGPRVVQFIEQVFEGASTAGMTAGRVTDLRKNDVSGWTFGGVEVWVARTGYTGEDGFEVVAPATVMEPLWTHVLAVGHVGCLQPCGLGARDTLRTEVCYPLYGHELDEDTTPIEAGLGVFVSFDKGDFVGRPVLWKQKSEGVAKRCIAFRMTGKSAPPRPGYAIHAGDVPIGTVVSGTQSPTLGVGIGLGYVPSDLATPGTRVGVDIRGRCFPAEVVRKPFYRKT
ncbi:MAG: glycine cleavage system aminomethyltransferase GcvT [Verrucomicrobiae bacterium]|nr:glycine cleavage system aminomethyltransferase GcvT [Verrucomicrobiae bacterium]